MSGRAPLETALFIERPAPAFQSGAPFLRIFLPYSPAVGNLSDGLPVPIFFTTFVSDAQMADSVVPLSCRPSGRGAVVVCPVANADCGVPVVETLRQEPVRFPMRGAHGQEPAGGTADRVGLQSGLFRTDGALFVPCATTLRSVIGVLRIALRRDICRQLPAFDADG